MIELSRAQDEEVGDGTTSVIILAGFAPNTSLRACHVQKLSSCSKTYPQPPRIEVIRI
jgi:hypothetical protein